MTPELKTGKTGTSDFRAVGFDCSAQVAVRLLTVVVSMAGVGRVLEHGTDTLARASRVWEGLLGIGSAGRHSTEFGIGSAFPAVADFVWVASAQAKVLGGLPRVVRDVGDLRCTGGLTPVVIIVSLIGLLGSLTFA